MAMDMGTGFRRGVRVVVPRANGLGRCGNFDIILDHFLRVSQPYATPQLDVCHGAHACLLDADWRLRSDVAWPIRVFRPAR